MSAEFAYLFPVQQHAVDALDGIVGRLLGLEVHESVALRVGIRGVL